MRRRQGKRSRRTAPHRRLVAAASAAPALALAGPVAYLGLTTVAAWRAIRVGEHHTDLPDRPRHRFVILIPAHNEEELIAGALASAEALDYPADLVRVHVVADNCTDGTVKIASASRAEVHERVAPDDGGKGPALQWLLNRLWDRGAVHDAVVIMDADTVFSPNFLRVMDAKLAGGAQIVQAYYGVRDPGTTPVTAVRAAALAARHYLRPLGRSHVGASVGLYGNGMVFRDDVLRSRRWSNHLVEDIEFQLESLLDGTKVAFAPDAMVVAEMPTTLEASQTQHQRWERGRIEMVQRFVPVLAARAVTGGPAGRVAYADAAADQLVPPFSLLALATSGASLLALVHTAVAPGRPARRRVVAAGALAAVQAVYVLSALRMVGARREVYRSLLASPRFVVWKVGLWAKVVRRPDDVAWVRTARNAEGAEGAEPG